MTQQEREETKVLIIAACLKNGTVPTNDELDEFLETLDE